MHFRTAQEMHEPTNVIPLRTCAQVNVQVIREALASAPDADLDAHIKGLNDLVARKRKEYNDAIGALADALSEKEARHG